MLFTPFTQSAAVDPLYSPLFSTHNKVDEAAKLDLQALLMPRDSDSIRPSTEKVLEVLRRVWESQEFLISGYSPETCQLFDAAVHLYQELLAPHLPLVEMGLRGKHQLDAALSPLFNFNQRPDALDAADAALMAALRIRVDTFGIGMGWSNWTTPVRHYDTALRLFGLQSDDIVFEPGCGTAALMSYGVRTKLGKFVGMEGCQSLVDVAEEHSGWSAPEGRMIVIHQDLLGPNRWPASSKVVLWEPVRDGDVDPFVDRLCMMESPKPLQVACFVPDRNLAGIAQRLGKTAAFTRDPATQDSDVWLFNRQY